MKSRYNTYWLFGLLLSLILLCCAENVAQMRGGKMPDRDRMPEENSLVYIEPLSFIGDSANSSRVDILYRISYDFFVFVVDTAVGARYPYFGHGDLSLEILDSTGASVARRIIHKQVGINAQRTGMSEKIYTQGIVSFQLHHGTYKLVTEVNDKESNRRYFNDKRLITVNPASSSDLRISDILLADVFDIKKESAELLPLNFGGDVPFGDDFDGFIEMSSSLPPESVTISYTLKKLSSLDHQEQVIYRETIPIISIIPSEMLVVEDGDNGTTYRLTKSGSPGKLGVRLFFKGDSLDEGEYDLRVVYKGGAVHDSLDKKFRIRWFDMPNSLRNPEISVKVMEYVMTDSEYAAYKKGNQQERIMKFRNYWKHRDPTPGTAYNEALAEYFRRVDYTAIAFATINERDGYRLDRGKAYIVYGPPGKTERDFTSNSSPQEIWYYPSLHKKITFVDQSHRGEYRLVSIDKY
jgi:GWxTD domain-containing protein